MENGFLGIPLYLWGVVCLGLAAVYTIVWPKPRAGMPPRSRLTHLILRWGHSLVWVLLAAAAFLSSAGVSQALNGLGLAAILIYLVFITTYQMERRMNQKLALRQALSGRSGKAGSTGKTNRPAKKPPAARKK